MHARAHLIVLLTLALTAAAQLAWSEEAPPAGAAGPRPPSITYPGTRSSQAWIEMPDGSRVGVDAGVEWQGVKVYLSLTWDLVGVEAVSGKTLYAVHVGAFWNRIDFEQVTPREGETTWAVALRPAAAARQGAAERQYRDLRSGARLDVPGIHARPSGKPFMPRAAWHGKRTRTAEAFRALVGTAKNWRALQARVFDASEASRFGTVNFEKEVVLVVADGNSWNCSGIAAAAAYEDETRVLLRLQHHHFQTMGGAEKVRPYGVFVLPRRRSKAYAVERNRQGLIGGPPLWTSTAHWGRLPRVEEQLGSVPAVSQAAHEGWER